MRETLPNLSVISARSNIRNQPRKRCVNPCRPVIWPMACPKVIWEATQMAEKREIKAISLLFTELLPD